MRGLFMQKISVSNTVFRFVLRALIGIGCVYFINIFLGNQGIVYTVGINLITFLTTGILGIPGVMVLYGISMYPLIG